MRATIAGIGAVVALMLAGCETTEPELVETSDQSDSADESTDADDEGDDDGEGDDGENSDATETFALGDTVAMGDVEHLLHGARWSEGDEYFGPEDGERWLVFDIELTNNGDEAAQMSSMMMWSLVDSESRTADVTITGDEQGSLDAELGAGRSLRGEVAFAVSDDGPWELIFEPEMFGSGQAIYQIEPGSVAGG